MTNSEQLLINLREMQLEVISMMRKIDKLFSDNGLTYTLLAGSVLGAIRHNGMIPWDDDIDVGLKRSDFEKAEELLSSCSEFVYESSDQHIIPAGPVGHLHLVNDKWPLENSPTIDIFALDKIPENKKDWKRYCRQAKIYHVCVVRRPPQHRGKIKKLVFTVFYRLVPKKYLDRLQKKYKRKVTAFNETGSTWMGNVFGCTYMPKEFFPADIYTELTLHEFEGLQLPIPAKYDTYLTQLYGDYMQLPPEDKRVPKHREF